MGDIPAGPAGFTRYLMKSTFGAGRDFACSTRTPRPSCSSSTAS